MASNDANMSDLFDDTLDDDAALSTPKPVRLFRPGTILVSSQQERTDDDQPQPSTSSAAASQPDNQASNESSSDVPVGVGKVASPAKQPPVESKSYKPNTIVINKTQKENPLIKCLRIPHAVDETIVPDYILTKNCCAFFLSIKYHNLKPTYIYDRLNALGSAFSLRILLLMVDVPEPRVPLKELTKFAVLANATLMVCWTFDEAARFLELYKQFEFKSPEILMEKQFANNKGVEGAFDCVVDALSCVKRINKTDAVSLLTNFESLSAIVKANTATLSLCHGLGPLKAEQLHALFRRPFTR